MSDQRTEPTRGTLTVAAIGDLHVRENNERRYRELFAEISEVADVLALAGDLTDFGKTGEAEMLAEDLARLHHSDGGRARQSRLRERSARRGGGDHAPGGRRHARRSGDHDRRGRLRRRQGLHRRVRSRRARCLRRDAIKVFVDESLNEARKLENQLRTLRSDRIMAILHYSPIAATVEGEPLEIFPFLGSSRLADAVDRFDNVKAGRPRPRPSRRLPR
jgi:Icc-related predicted phosphoesterase